MKRLVAYTGFIALLSGILMTGASAQFPEDALRLSLPGTGVGARALGMGMAYTGIANDYSAAYWNPAGLGQIKTNELSLGLSYLSYGNTGSLYGSDQSFTNSSTNFNNIGLVYPFPVSKGSLVFAFGYGRQSDFTTGLSFSGFNPISSVAQSWAPDGVTFSGSPSGNLAYELYLADADSISPGIFRWNSKVLDSLTQAGKVIEGGGLNYVTGSMAFEAAKDLYFGATINFITGSYSYTRNYSETSPSNITRAPGYDIYSINTVETINDDISGFTMKLGMLYKFAPTTRLGLTIQTPSWITVHETYSQSGSSLFYTEPFAGVGTSFNYTSYDNVHNDYDVVTPFVFSVGLSHSIQDLMLSGDVDYTDYTQIEFRNADQSLLDENITMKSLFRPTANLRVGGEYAFPEAGVRLRAGFAYMPSPYSGDPSDFAKKYITGGLGLIVQDAIAIDLGYAYGYWNNFIVNYDSTSKVTEKITTSNILATVSYRF
jgi:long-subunit fatty acid transport protein